MSKGPGIDPSVARRVDDAGFDVALPSEKPDELREMTKEAWMAKYGTVLKNRLDFEARHPNWHTNKSSWWYRSVGRDGNEEPLWLADGYHFAELDCPEEPERESRPLQELDNVPLWAERIGLKGGRAPAQSASIYDHRAEYLPSQVSGPATMHGRFQPSFSRIQSHELPDRTDVPDGRFWLAGVAQGQVTDPYRNSASGIGRRKPIVLGPHTISAVVDGETHTLGNTFRDVAWTVPEIEFAGYSCEHPGYNHVNLRVQTSREASITAERGMVQTLSRLKDIADVVDDGMGRALEAWTQTHAPC